MAVDVEAAPAGLRELTGRRDVLRLFGSQLVGRLPIGMADLAIVLLVRQRGGSYALAGLLAGVMAISTAVSSPLLGRLSDRVGARVVVLTGAVLAAGAAIAFAITTTDHATPASLAAALVLGAAEPPLSPCFRALLPDLVGRDRLHALYAIDSTTQELVFITGPLIVVGVASVSSIGVAVASMSVLVLAGSVVFASAPTVRAAPRNQRRDAEGALRSSGLRTICVVVAVAMLGFGAVQVAVPAACEVSGSRTAAGYVMTIWAFGSLVGGFLYATSKLRGDARTHLLICLCLNAAGTVACLISPSPYALAAALFCVGLVVAPAFSCVFVLVERTAVGGSLTEAFSWIQSAFAGGFAAGSAVAGVLIDVSGWRLGFAFAAAAVLGAGVLSLALRRFLVGVA